MISVSYICTYLEKHCNHKLWHLLCMTSSDVCQNVCSTARIILQQNHTYTGNMGIICICCYFCSVAKSCPTFCDPMDCSPPGCFVHGILQTRILQWVAMLSSRGPSWPRDQTCVCCISCLGRQILYHWATWEACLYSNAFFIPNPSEQVFCPFLWFKEVWSCYIGVVFFFFFFFLRYYKFLFEIR